MENTVISIQSSTINRMVTGLNAASTNFKHQTLASTDNISTITANQGAKDAFSNAQDAHIIFANALSASGRQLVTISNSFRNLDVSQVRQFNTLPT
ncbi:MAG: TIGR04197 family type VII secretion effector [Oscillospiraceae bacterium]|nr:TIGR04197 family type VII secretion effector [Oscillospiraceae bacterium]